MNMYHTLLAAIKEYLSKGHTQRRLALEAGISSTTLSEFLSGKKTNISLSTLVGLANVIDLNLIHKDKIGENLLKKSVEQQFIEHPMDGKETAKYLEGLGKRIVNGQNEGFFQLYSKGIEVKDANLKIFPPGTAVIVHGDQEAVIVGIGIDANLSVSYKIRYLKDGDIKESWLFVFEFSLREKEDRKTTINFHT